MARQYAFQPREADPRIDANSHWDEMRNELNMTRDALEASNAECVSQASLIDMLRKELADTKSAHDRDQVALTVMRTKLKAAGMLVLDALKDAPEEKPKPQLRLQDIPKREVATPVAEIEEEKDEELEEAIRGISALANKWP